MRRDKRDWRSDWTGVVVPGMSSYCKPSAFNEYEAKNPIFKSVLSLKTRKGSKVREGRKPQERL